LIEKLGLVDVVHMPGFAADDELRKIMAKAKICVQTSHTEGLSLALLESMAAGLAIAATDVGDTAVAVEDNTSGIIIPPKDEEKLTDSLRRLIINTDLRNQLAAAARQRTVERFSIQAMADRAAVEYQTLTERT
jgi:mannosyltransferase